MHHLALTQHCPWSVFTRESLTMWRASTDPLFARQRKLPAVPVGLGRPALIWLKNHSEPPLGYSQLQSSANPICNSEASHRFEFFKCAVISILIQPLTFKFEAFAALAEAPATRSLPRDPAEGGRCRQPPVRPQSPQPRSAFAAAARPAEVRGAGAACSGFTGDPGGPGGTQARPQALRERGLWDRLRP